VEKLKRIKLLAMDVDGVLTDGSMIVSAEGDTKVFNVYDGLGIGLAMAAGLEVVWITGNVSPAVARRAESLGITELFQGARYKSVALLQIAETQGLALEEIAYIGDDLNDLPALESAGVGFAVANAVSEVKDAADIVTAQPGGRGAVRGRGVADRH
jgi:3-deoxy-D-manno-octulosonate 8-phosphate phosphatase (KDO 8-P phosphatase)